MYIFASMSYRLSIAALTLLTFGCGSPEQPTQQEKAPEKEMQESENTEALRRIVFFGNSITAGYQLDIEDAFPQLIQERLDSLGEPYVCINAGQSGETSAGGLQRLDWVLKAPVDIFVLELGANDGLLGLPLTETESNLLGMIEKVKAKNPEVRVLLTGMEVPPNMGQEYASEFRNVFKRVAEKADVAFLPFLLQGVAGDRSLNLSDGIHPTKEGHRKVMENVWEALKPLL